MIIRESQLATFSPVCFENYVSWLVMHVGRRFPEQCSAFGPERTQSYVRFGIRRAARYGIVGKRDICAFVDVMFALGLRFDTFPWAGGVLNDRDSGAAVKVSLVLEAANIILDCIGTAYGRR